MVYFFWSYSYELTKFCRRARSADLRRKIGSQYELPMKKFGIKGRAIKLKAWSPSHMSGLEGEKSTLAP
jgi:hypothetical protein